LETRFANFRTALTLEQGGLPNIDQFSKLLYAVNHNIHDPQESSSGANARPKLVYSAY
jgi:hypothetical protein